MYTHCMLSECIQVQNSTFQFPFPRVHVILISHPRRLLPLSDSILTLSKLFDVPLILLHSQSPDTNLVHDLRVHQMVCSTQGFKALQGSNSSYASFHSVEIGEVSGNHIQNFISHLFSRRSANSHSFMMSYTRVRSFASKL